MVAIGKRIYFCSTRTKNLTDHYGHLLYPLSGFSLLQIIDLFFLVEAEKIKLQSLVLFHIQCCLMAYIGKRQKMGGVK